MSLSRLTRSLPLRTKRTLFTAAEAAKRYAPLDIHPEVQDALVSNKPVVALETTLVTHGIPQPTNYELATSLEDIVRSNGAIPATIGIVEGRVKVGLEKHELQRLADRTRYPNTVKVSRRDIGPMISARMDGGTTCSATLIFAAMAGIKVFATGGLGGVHRGGEMSLDVSADLHELTRCPVGLVSSGVKSILDIGRTLEYLESLGVPVVTYGPTKDFPAFFTRYSGFQVPYNVNTPSDAARILHTQHQFGLANGTLIAVPIPEAYQEIGSSIERSVEQAVAESEANGVSRKGKEATPWLLSRIAELTGGDSLRSNIALLKNTASVGGQIAVQYQKISEEGNVAPVSAQQPTFTTPAPEALRPASLAVIGSAAIDLTAKVNASSEDSLAAHSTLPGSVELSLGGVARNVAEAAHRVSSSPSTTLLVSPVGKDSFGSLLLSEMARLGMRTDGMLESDMRTAVCNMLLSKDGQLITGVADMDITAKFEVEKITAELDKHRPDLIAFDGNLSPEAVKSLVEYCNAKDISTFFEPTSISKSTIILPSIPSTADWSLRAPITFISPNILELKHIYQTAREDPYDLMSLPAWWSVIDNLALGSEYRSDLERLARRPVSDTDDFKGTLSFLAEEGVAGMAVNLLPFIQHVVIKCGGLGVVAVLRVSGMAATGWKKSNIAERYIVAQGNAGQGVVVAHFPPLEVGSVANVTGAGDSFVGVLLRLLQDPKATRDHVELKKVIDTAQRAAVLTLQSDKAVSPALSDMQKW